MSSTMQDKSLGARTPLIGCFEYLTILTWSMIITCLVRSGKAILLLRVALPGVDAAVDTVGIRLCPLVHPQLVLSVQAGVGAPCILKYMWSDIYKRMWTLSSILLSPQQGPWDSSHSPQVWGWPPPGEGGSLWEPTGTSRSSLSHQTFNKHLKRFSCTIILAHFDSYNWWWNAWNSFKLHVTSQYKNRCGRRNKKKCAILTCWPHGSPLPSECSPVSKADRALASMRTLAPNKRYTGCAWKLPNCSATNPLNVAEA